MGKIPLELREMIAANIRACRMKQYPGRGGGKKCAEAFGVSPQQWSPWERGMRTPDEQRLKDLAEFFGVTVGFLRGDSGQQGQNASPSAEPMQSEPPSQNEAAYPPPSSHFRCPFYSPPQPGQPFSGHVRSLCWLAEQLFGDTREHGLPIRLHPKDVDMLIDRFIKLNHPPQ